MSLIQTVPLGGVEFGEKASAEDVAAAKAAFQPVSYGNLRLWEIYDEDGVEIEVGEVRKTIDGVKKSKPVYERTFVLNNSSVSFSASWSSVSGIVVEDIEYLVDKTIRRMSFASTKQGLMSTISCAVQNNGTIVFRNEIDESITFAVGSSFTLRYTKTTDEWQPV